MSVGVDLTGLVLPERMEELSRSQDGRKAQFALQPLERGFGHTIGNTIRRILLSSLPGAAVWAFRADGVQHEHQTIDGVAEDVHQMVQKLKRLVLKLDPDIDEVHLELNVHQEGPVRASQITPHAGVTLVEPDHVLFTLEEPLPENRPLRVDLWVDRGRGFRMAERHRLSEDRKQAAPVGQILVDSIYNPVLRANFTVTETRVGERTDFDRLVLDVETNGALDPEEAVRQASEIGRAHLAYLTRFGASSVETIQQGDGTVVDVGEMGEDLLQLLEKPLESFEQISARSRNTLDKGNIRTLGDVAARTRAEMLDVPNFGEKSLEEVAEALAEHGLHFGMFARGADGELQVRPDASGNGAGIEVDIGSGDET